MEDFYSALALLFLVVVAAVGAWMFRNGVRDPSRKGDRWITFAFALWAATFSALVILWRINQ